AGSGQTAAGLALVELVEVLARQGVRGLDLEDPAEGRARGGEITGVELGDPFVEDLFDLALLLGLELSRALDLARRLVVVDVDQEDARPGVDRRLVLAAIER